MRGGVGDTLGGRYRLIELLEEDRLGTVWRARDEQLVRPVTLRVLRRDAGATVRERFLARALAAATIAHPRAVRIFDVVEAGPSPFVVTEHVDGRSLEADIRAGGARSASETMAIVDDVAAALEAAHASGVIHGAVSPATVLVERGGAAKLAGFGVARAARDDSEELSKEADVRGLAAVAYASLTGALGARIGDRTLGAALDGVFAGVVQAGRARYATPVEFSRALARAVRSADPTERLPVVAPVRWRVLVPGFGRTLGWATSRAPHVSASVLAGVAAIVVLGGIAAAMTGPGTTPPRASATATAAPRAATQAIQTTPDLIGTAATAAVARLRQAGFRNDVEIRIDPSSRRPSGTVIGQEPAAGTPYRTGDRAKLVVAGSYDSK